MIVRLSKWGNSQGIRLSKDLLESANIHSSFYADGKNVEFAVSVIKGTICLTPLVSQSDRKPTKLDKLLAEHGLTAETFVDMFDEDEFFGRPVSNEVW